MDAVHESQPIGRVKVCTIDVVKAHPVDISMCFIAFWWM